MGLKIPKAEYSIADGARNASHCIPPASPKKEHRLFPYLLGGGVFKKQLNNNPHRSIILAKAGRYGV